MSSPLVINDKVTLPGSDLEWTAVRSSGPGGQNVNKVASKIELSFDFETSVALSDPAKARLRVLAKNSFDAEGRVFIKSENGEIFHTYSTYGRGLGEILGTYMYLDITPKGRNENGPKHDLTDWVRLHDRYDSGGYVDATGRYRAPDSEHACCAPTKQDS